MVAGITVTGITITIVIGIDCVKVRPLRGGPERRGGPRPAIGSQQPASEPVTSIHNLANLTKALSGKGLAQTV